MKKTAMIALAMSALIFAACRHTSDSDYEAEQMEFAKEQEELEAEQEELRREYEYIREKAEFKKELQALKKGVRKERNTNTIKRDSTKRQLNENEASELTDKVKSAGLWPTDK